MVIMSGCVHKFAFMTLFADICIIFATKGKYPSVYSMHKGHKLKARFNFSPKSAKI